MRWLRALSWQMAKHCEGQVSASNRVKQRGSTITYTTQVLRGSFFIAVKETVKRAKQATNDMPSWRTELKVPWTYGTVKGSRKPFESDQRKGKREEAQGEAMPNPLDIFTDAEIRHFLSVFQLIDEDGNGVVDPEELAKVLGTLVTVQYLGRSLLTPTC
jgi:EF-hand domain